MMTAIHPLSSLTPVPELDLFSVPPTQLSIQRNQYTEDRPISILGFNSPIQYIIETSPEDYIQMRESLLYLLVRVDISKSDNTDIEAFDWTHISSVNYWMHSMFKHVDVEINGKVFTQSPQTYAYKAYMEQLLFFTSDSKNTFLSGTLHIEDNTADKEALVSARSKFITPNIIEKDGKGKVVELLGKLHIDLAFQNKAIIGGFSMKVTLIPHHPSFYMQRSLPKYSISVSFLNAVCSWIKSVT